MVIIIIILCVIIHFCIPVIHLRDELITLPVLPYPRADLLSADRERGRVDCCTGPPGLPYWTDRMD